jgi:hypothetical protein
MSSDRHVHLNVEEIEAETDKAFCLRLKDDKHSKKVWVPKSVIIDCDDYAEGDTDCTVSVHEWFAEKEGLE